MFCGAQQCSPLWSPELDALGVSLFWAPSCFRCDGADCCESAGKWSWPPAWLAERLCLMQLLWSVHWRAGQVSSMTCFDAWWGATAVGLLAGAAGGNTLVLIGQKQDSKVAHASPIASTVDQDPPNGCCRCLCAQGESQLPSASLGMSPRATGGLSNYLLCQRTATELGLRACEILCMTFKSRVCSL